MTEKVPNEAIIDPERFAHQAGVVTNKLRKFTADRLVVAAISGMPTTQIAPKLGLTPEQVGALPTGKIGDHYALGRIVIFAPGRPLEKNGCYAAMKGPILTGFYRKSLKK